MTSKGQITIPVRLRKKLGLQTGSVLEFDEHAQNLTAKRVLGPEVFREFAQDASDPFPGLTVLETLDELRGPVEIPQKADDENRD